MLVTDKKQLEKFHTSHRVWQGIPAIIHTNGGHTYIAFYSGSTSETAGNYVVLLRSNNDREYGEPIAVVYSGEYMRCFDPCLWIDPLGRLWFTWAETCDSDNVKGVICDDPDAEELVWGNEFLVGSGIMMNKPTALSTGEWLFPIARWKNERNAHIPISDPNGPGAFVYKTTDNGRTFKCLGGADVLKRNFDEHMVVEKKNGILWMLVRVCDGIGESYSYDSGLTWSRGQLTSLGGPNSRFHIRRLNSGRILLINHYQTTKRSNLTAFLSDDDGNSFKYMLTIDEREEVSYPDSSEGEDGYIYIVYDRARGGFKSSLDEAYGCAREILTAKITENDIIAGELVSEKSFLKHVASKLGKLAEGDPDPYVKPELSNIDFARQLIERKIMDPVGEVFKKYPLNCLSIQNFDAENLDKIIERFNDSERKDERILCEIIDFIRRAPQKEVEIIPIIDKVKTFIEANITENISLSDVARGVNISACYLSHLFKDVTGITVTEFCNSLRLKNAKKLLVNTEKSIAEIALEVGFGSPSYFTEVFTRSESIPPSEYRKYHKK